MGEPLEKLQIKPEYHAYIIEGGFEKVKAAIIVAIKKNGGSPKIFINEHNVFGINDSHTLRRMQNRRNPSGEQCYFVTGIDSFTTEAQNALLKTFEDPSRNTHFFIIVPSLSIVLPTLISRCQVLVDESKKIKTELDAKSFLGKKPSERTKLIMEILKHGDTDGERADRLRAIQKFLKEATDYILSLDLEVIEKKQALMAIGKSDIYLRTKGALPKLLAEHLALVLPVLK